MLVGPASDPEGIRGFDDAVNALQQIYSSRNKLLVHVSHDAMEVQSDIMADAGLEFDSDLTFFRLDDRHRQMLLIADHERAYTAIVRIPFINSKVSRSNLAIMVQGHSRLRRPYLAATAPPGKLSAGEQLAVRRFVAILRSKATQKFIAGFCPWDVRRSAAVLPRRRGADPLTAASAGAMMPQG